MRAVINKWENKVMSYRLRNNENEIERKGRGK